MNTDQILITCLISFIVLITYQRYFLNLLDPVSYFSLSHIVLFFMGAFYRSFYEWTVPIDDAALILICVSMISFALGSSMQFFIGRTMDSIRFTQVPKHNNFNRDFDPHYTNAALILLLIGISGTIIFILKNNGIIWLRSDFDDYRIVARAGLGWLVIISITFTTYSAIALFTKYLFCRNIVLALIFAVTGAFLVIQFGNRAPAFEIVVACSFIFCWHRWKKIPFVLLIIGGLSIFLLLGALQIFRQGIDADLIMLLLQSIWRPFVNIQNFNLIYLSVPTVIPFQHGNSFLMDIAVLAPGYQPNFGTWLKDALGLDFTGGSVTITYLGEFYANFGYIGSIFCSFTLGFILSLISYNLKHLYYEPSFYPYLFGISITAKAIISSGIITPVIYVLIPYMLTHTIFKFNICISHKLYDHK